MQKMTIKQIFKMRIKPSKRLSVRSYAAVFAFCLFFFVLIINLFLIQIVHGEENRLKAERRQFSDTVVSAHRGTIYDSNMKVIAQSASVWLVYVNPSKITDETKKNLIADAFVNIFDLDRETVMKKLNKSKSGYEKIIGQIDNAKKNELRAFMTENKGYNLGEIIGIDPDTKRYYPLESFASTIVGFTGSGDEGRSGLEYQYNDVLKGTAGRIITAKNARGYEMPNDYRTAYDAKQGYSLVLTIDEVIQYYLEQQLSQALDEYQAQYAYGIVMDVKTGAILGMSNKPDYDLNSPYKISSGSVLEEIEKITDPEEKSTELKKAQNAQWRNRTVADSYEPGSVFKVIVAAAALEEGILTPETTYNCTGQIKVANYYQHCFHRTSHGVQTLNEALPNSCNTFFITMGQRMGQETFLKYFEAFGFTEPTGIDLPAEAKPIAATKNAAGASIGTYHSIKTMGITELSSASFGQTFQASPIQIINAVSALGNGGKLMTPYLVSKILDENGNLVSETKPVVKRQVISEKTAALMSGYMEQVCISGTAKNAYVAGYHIAGKTGTSEKIGAGEKGQNIASFAGFAPADDPKIAVLIAIDDPKGLTTGGAVAAPIAGRIFENILAYLNVDPKYSDAEMASATVTAPNLVGAATNTVKSQANGFIVKVVGNGEEVISQVPSANQSMPKGGIIVVYTEENASKQIATVPNLTGLSMADANRIAVNAGFNIKIAGTTQGSGSVVSYKQSSPAESEGEVGTVITVYFRSSENISD